jgi:hypothetical protein
MSTQNLPNRNLSDQDLHREMQQAAKEPLLPVEKKLIVGSITLGVILLVVLAVLGQFFGA